MTGLLLINLGTPAAPETGAVRSYLRQFLSDPRVLDMNAVGRAALLNLVILPTRPAKSAKAYRQIWTERGSPLLYHSKDLAVEVSQRLGDGWRVELGMRYGEPSIESALERLRTSGADDIVVLPLYPQYSASSTGSSAEEVYRIAARHWVVPPISVLGPFYADPGFIAAFAAVGAPVLAAQRPDHILFSYHGLPERHMHKADATGAHCLRSTACCDELVAANKNCYRAQCFATTRALVTALDLAPGTWTISFQSRLTKEWITPFTDQVLPALAQAGKRRVAVFCPAFVADCLETLEEIGIRAREDFLKAGGESLELVPSLNASPAWADAVAALARGRS